LNELSKKLDDYVDDQLAVPYERKMLAWNILSLKESILDKSLYEIN
jgi:hypothetical protein